MNHRLGIVGAKARGLGLLTAAVLAGGVAASALPSLAAGGSDDSHRVGRTQRATEPDDRDAHGRCVSKVARDHNAIGGPHHNHGGAVSAAAHSCPHG